MPESMNPAPHGEGASALIVAIARQRDRRAFAEIFAYFAPRLKAYLQRSGTPAGVAEEMAQETLLVVWRKAEQYDPARAGAAAWIFTIARNLRIDAQRRARLALPDLDPTDEPPPPPLADALLATEQREGRVRNALADLPPDQSEALRLAFFEERSHSEIESDLGVPLGTVKSRLRLAIMKLRTALKDDE